MPALRDFGLVSFCGFQKATGVFCFASFDVSLSLECIEWMAEAAHWFLEINPKAKCMAQRWPVVSDMQFWMQLFRSHRRALAWNHKQLCGGDSSLSRCPERGLVIDASIFHFSIINHITTVINPSSCRHLNRVQSPEVRTNLEFIAGWIGGESVPGCKWSSESLEDRFYGFRAAGESTKLMLIRLTGSVWMAGTCDRLN